MESIEQPYITNLSVSEDSDQLSHTAQTSVALFKMAL